ncbi:RcpC/CpaB family pilus assembly protein [Sneathiella aquimaris]|uniref:RcpC/CpaB family pilus assembly protein n=1 Tax=Sneathiella aquimaris TaxID=2599305 RepID=UPI00146AF144|nr:RcpC/CpaB family pilus assembly protein [Sneathiella aquimaris]
MKSFIFFFCCILFLGAAIYLGFMLPGWSHVIAPTRANNQITQLEKLAVVTEDMAPGSILGIDSLSGSRRPDPTHKFYLLSDVEARVDRYFSVNAALFRGEPIPVGAITWISENEFLRKTLRAGHQALSLSGREVALNRADINPGDYLDLYLTVALNGQTPKTETVLLASNIRVLKTYPETTADVGRLSDLTVEIPDGQVTTFQNWKTRGQLSVSVLPNSQTPQGHANKQQIISASLQRLQKSLEALVQPANIPARPIIIQRGQDRFVFERQPDLKRGISQ